MRQLSVPDTLALTEALHLLNGKKGEGSKNRYAAKILLFVYRIPFQSTIDKRKLYCYCRTTEGNMKPRGQTQHGIRN